MKIQAKGGWEVTILNDVHGTEKAPAAVYDVQIVKRWFDYETGERFVGMVTRQEDADRIAQAGRTAYGPKDSAWDPTLVYFSDDVILGGR